jgi:hypothetical protein
VAGEEDSVLATIGRHGHTLPAKVGSEQENGRIANRDWSMDHRLEGRSNRGTTTSIGRPKVQQFGATIERAVFGLSLQQRDA